MPKVSRNISAEKFDIQVGVWSAFYAVLCDFSLTKVRRFCDYVRSI